MMLIKLRPLVFLVLSRSGLAYKYGIIFQILIYIVGCRIAYSDTWYNNCQ